MRVVITAVLALFAASAVDTARADPYPWCAVYGGSGNGGGGTNCYMRTYQQCLEAISGMGGFCAPNTFYTGPRERTRRSAPRDRSSASGRY
jgi:hypothetical protein